MAQPATPKTPKPSDGVSIAAVLRQNPSIISFHTWLVGDTPLITHAWSEKARREMLAKQVKSVKTARAIREPEEDFTNSLYEMGDGTFGFPVTGIKNSLMSSAHKDRGIARTDARAALWLNGELVRTRPALAGAICDMPLVRIWGSKPEMREDMVRVGPSKTATLAYRAQFTHWAIHITGRLSTDVVPLETVAFLMGLSGTGFGIGEWRNEKSGMFGAYHPARDHEQAAWDAFRAGTGSLPIGENYIPDQREAAE